MNQVIDDARLKTFVKEALFELIRERKDEFRELLAEALEDYEDAAMIRAINEGMETEEMPLDEFRAWLRSGYEDHNQKIDAET